MKIGMIGAGNIGATLARKFVAAGHAVKLAGSKGPDAIREKADTIGALAATSQDATRDVDVIILSIPFASIPDVAPVFKDVPAGVTVIDTTNYYPGRDGKIAEVENGMPESVWTSGHLGRPVVKTFNALLAHTLAEKGAPRGSVGRIAVPIAGDDPAARALARQLVDDAGFDGVDAGDLNDSWKQQPGSPAYCTELTRDDLAQALSNADKARIPRKRDAVTEAFMGAATMPGHEDTVKLNREVSASS